MHTFLQPHQDQSSIDSTTFFTACYSLPVFTSQFRNPVPWSIIIIFQNAFESLGPLFLYHSCLVEPNPGQIQPFCECASVPTLLSKAKKTKTTTKKPHSADNWCSFKSLTTDLKWVCCFHAVLPHSLFLPEIAWIQITTLVCSHTSS